MGLFELTSVTTYLEKKGIDKIILYLHSCIMSMMCRTVFALLMYNDISEE